MAQRRMVSLKIIDTDKFLEMPLSSQCLYFHLLARADDDGFIGSTKKIVRMVGSSDDDLKILLAKNYIIPFDNGVCVIKDWKIHNYIQKDRYNETIYKSEKNLLEENENASYNLISPQNTKCIQNVYKEDTQVRLGKVSIELGKDKKEKEEKECHILGEFNNIKLTDEHIGKLKELYGNKFDEAIETLSSYIQSSGKKYKDFYAVLNKHNWVYKKVMYNNTQKTKFEWSV